MSKITFISTIPDATLEKIALVHGYKATVPNPDFVSETATPDIEPTITNPETAIIFAAVHVLGRACAEIGVHESTFPEMEELTPKQFETLKNQTRVAIYTSTVVEVNDIVIPPHLH